jgi:hypothetical protein
MAGMAPPISGLFIVVPDTTPQILIPVPTKISEHGYAGKDTGT